MWHEQPKQIFSSTWLRSAVELFTEVDDEDMLLLWGRRLIVPPIDLFREIVINAFNEGENNVFSLIRHHSHTGSHSLPLAASLYIKSEAAMQPWCNIDFAFA